jgi:hypothetical protein
MLLPLQTPLTSGILIILLHRDKLGCLLIRWASVDGLNVFSSGNLKLDLLHNFFLECGARANKIRVYEMCESPTARG